MKEHSNKDEARRAMHERIVRDRQFSVDIDSPKEREASRRQRKREQREQERMREIPKVCPRCKFDVPKNTRSWDKKTKVCWSCSKCGKPSNERARVVWVEEPACLIHSNSFAAWRASNDVPLREAAHALSCSVGLLSMFERRNNVVRVFVFSDAAAALNIPFERTHVLRCNLNHVRRARAISDVRFSRVLQVQRSKLRPLLKNDGPFTEAQRKLIDDYLEKLDEPL